MEEEKEREKPEAGNITALVDLKNTEKQSEFELLWNWEPEDGFKECKWYYWREINVISTESLQVLKETNKQKQEWMDRTNEVVSLYCFWLTGKDGTTPVTVRKNMGKRKVKEKTKF